MRGLAYTRNLLLAAQVTATAIAFGGSLDRRESDLQARCGGDCDDKVIVDGEVCQLVEVVYSTIWTFVPGPEETGGVPPGGGGGSNTPPGISTKPITMTLPTDTSPAPPPSPSTTVITVTSGSTTFVSTSTVDTSTPLIPTDTAPASTVITVTSGSTTITTTSVETSSSMPSPSVITSSTSSVITSSTVITLTTSSTTITTTSISTIPTNAPHTFTATSKTVPSTTSAPITTSVPSTTTTTSMTTTTHPTPSFSCDPYGYLIQSKALYAVDITDGGKTLVKDNVGDGRNINAIGYHSKENVIYGITQTNNGPANLIRIFADGNSDVLDEVPHNDAKGNPTDIFVGEIDEDYQLYYAHSGTNWWQLDLDPASPTYRQVVNSGVSDAPYKIDDWVHVPMTDDNALWSIGEDTSKSPSEAILMKWETTDHTWTVVKNFGHLAGNDRFGALYADNEGNMYGSENFSGNIYKFNIADIQAGGDPEFLTPGPTSQLNDGARCHDVAVQELPPLPPVS